ncbi:peptidase domain-containing ABC transporter [Flavobacterium jejuense]|uniref:Peptidase domain-containing ABC transporter n=1 Tax=Flavobacterium jejuense TaxID=1544455 RepID=A0ABX0IV88_9FLAO|nr:peptidase domain-containing ABC transporter [Flavobacterium jejuense]NHN27378.1 peptidase domain-containing ABC transporter [Flavobacterium jejuense]
MLNLKIIKSTFAKQLDQSDCGVTCLLSVIKLNGGNISLEKLRELSGTNKQGTTMLGLYQAANQVGFTAEGCEADIQILINHKQPVILHVVIENQLQHYVVCYEYNSEKGFLIGDPAKGICYLSAEELDKIWVSKSCLTLEINESFITTKTEKHSQKKWFLDILKEDYKLLWISVLLGVFIACLGMAMAIFSQKLIDDILPSENKTKLFSGVALLTILLLARVGISVLREFFLMQQSKDFNNRINSQFFTRLLHLPKSFFDTRKIGELVARLNDTQRIQRVIKQLASSLVIDVLVAIFSTVFLFLYSWKVGLLCLFSLPVYFVIIYRSNKKIIAAQKEVMQSYAFNESNYISSMQGIATIKNDNKQSIFSKANDLIFGLFQEKIFDLGKINIKLSWQSGIASVLFLISILIFTSIQVLNKDLKLGELMAILGIAGGLLPSIANLALVTIPINEAKIAFNRMYEFASIEKEKEEGELITEINSIAIQNLSFRFAGRKELLKNITIPLVKDKITAIVGESGSGKSTLGQILQRFYNFENGSIIVNNQHQLNAIELKSFRNLIGVIPQEITIFNGNVIDNILLGATETPENIMHFLTSFGFDAYFNQLPQGIATILGEEGINLSGGQKQIIALARVLYKKPQFLILDEVTSAMDRNTERFTMNLFEKIKSNCIIFFISHRLHTLKQFADEVYVLENGTIAISGTHDELLQTDNFYSEYWKEV